MSNVTYMKEILALAVENESSIAATIFTMPNQVNELVSCLTDFVLVVILILLLISAWTDYNAIKGKTLSKKQKIFFWEMATFAAIFIFYAFGHYCVVLPLMFMLSILVLWYLVQVYAR